MKYPTLEDLFSNASRLRIIKFFMRNPENFFEKKDVSKRLGIRKNALEKEVKSLISNNVLKIKKSGKDTFFALNEKFYLYNEIKNLIEKSIPISDEELISKLQSLGKIQLALAAGVFINKSDSRSDLFVVGKVSPSKLGNFIKYVESQVGKELNFVVMSSDEFKYRHKMFDRFVHDMMELPHKKLISKIRISE